MDGGNWKEFITLLFKKYRWALLVLLAGLLLMALPEGESQDPQPQLPAQNREQTLQQELEELLSQLEGAGKVSVLLTPATGAQTHYQVNEDQQRSDSTKDSRTEAVIITSSDRSQTGLIRRVDPPTWQGAVVLCQGADRAQVRLAVVDAVATATGLTSDRIAVWKMK